MSKVYSEFQLSVTFRSESKLQFAVFAGEARRKLHAEAWTLNFYTKGRIQLKTAIRGLTVVNIFVIAKADIS